MNVISHKKAQKAQKGIINFDAAGTQDLETHFVTFVLFVANSPSFPVLLPDEISL